MPKKPERRDRDREEDIDIAGAKPSPAPSPPAETKIPSVEMKPDEIEVDGYVTKKDVRGTSKDPRATKEEQWRITVQIEDIGLRKMIQSDHGHYDKLKVADKIKVGITRVNTRGCLGG